MCHCYLYDYSILTVLFSALCTERPNAINPVLDAIFPYLSRPYAGYRTASVATVSTFITHSGNDRDRLYRYVFKIQLHMGLMIIKID